MPATVHVFEVGDRVRHTWVDNGKGTIVEVDRRPYGNLYYVDWDNGNTMQQFWDGKDEMIRYFFVGALEPISILDQIAEA